MTAGKFASITASLLARKGEAKPWQDSDLKISDWHHNPPKQAGSTQPTDASNLGKLSPANPPPNEKHAITLQKKCAVRMSVLEYEQLGILAVKNNCTRQQLLREALAQLLTALAQDYRNQCPCLRRCDTNSCDFSDSSPTAVSSHAGKV